MYLGEIIYKYRKEKKLTMDAFSQLSGLSKSYISMLEKNKHPQSSRKLIPSVETFKKVAKAIEIDTDELFRMVSGSQLVKLSDKKENSLEGLTNISFPAAKAVPILGDICAGGGVICEDNYQGNFYIDRSIKADMCLYVKGDSMIDAGIYNGDIAFIRKNYNYSPGNIYAVRINDGCDAVLKKVYIKENSAILSPCNAAYEPMIVAAGDFSIIGEYTGVFHSAI